MLVSLRMRATAAKGKLSINNLSMEQNSALTFSQEVFFTIREDGELVAIEEQNGHVTRFTVSKADKAATLKIFGADKVRTV